MMISHFLLDTIGPICLPIGIYESISSVATEGNNGIVAGWGGRELESARHKAQCFSGFDFLSSTLLSAPRFTRTTHRTSDRES